MAEQKRLREFLAEIIRKHNISLDRDDVDRSAGDTHVMNANDDYEAFLTHKHSKFFRKETAAKRKPKEAARLI